MSDPAKKRFYVTTPIYYVNAEPHLGHAYTTIVGDALTRWHRLLGDDVKFLTGTDEHGLKIQQAAEAAGLVAAGVRRRRSPRVRRGVEAPRTSPTTTSSARPSRATRRPSPSCCSAATTPATSSSTCYQRQVLRALRGCTTPTTSCSPGDLCPIHKLPVDDFEEENYFFRLSRFQDRLLDWYAAHPAAIVPEFRGNEALGLIRGGLRDFSVSRTSARVGHPAAVGLQATSPTSGSTRSPTTSPPSASATDDRATSSEWWPVDYHLIGKDIIRYHCVYWPAMLMSAGIEPPKGWAVGGWLLVGGEKMSKTTGNVVNPLDLVDDVGVDGFRYYVLADTPYGNDGDFTVEGLVGRYNADLANNLGNLARPRRHRGRQEVRRRRPGAGRRQPARRGRGRRAYAGAAAAWDVVAPSRALDATWQLIRATNAYLEANEPWKAEPGPEVDAVLGDALEALRIVAILASPAIPDDRPGGLGAHRPAGRRRRPTAPGGRRVGRLPRRARRHQGRRRCSRASRDATGRVDGWFDCHCHVHDERIPAAPVGAVRGRRDAGVTTMVTVGCDRATSLAAIAVAARHRRRATPPSGCTRTRPSNGVDTIVDLLDDAAASSPSASPGSTTTTTTRRATSQRDAFAAQIQLAHERGLPLVIHTRDAWDDTFDILAAEGAPERTIFHCFTGGPDEAGAASTSARSSASRASSRSRAPPRSRRRPRSCPLDRMLVETDSPYLAPVPHRGKPNRPAWVPPSGAFIAELRGVPSTSARRHHGQRRRRFGRPPRARADPRRPTAIAPDRPCRSPGRPRASNRSRPCQTDDTDRRRLPAG